MWLYPSHAMFCIVDPLGRLSISLLIPLFYAIHSDSSITRLDNTISSQLVLLPSKKLSYRKYKCIDRSCSQGSISEDCVKLISRTCNTRGSLEAMLNQPAAHTPENILVIDILRHHITQASSKYRNGSQLVAGGPQTWQVHHMELCHIACYQIIF